MKQTIVLNKRKATGLPAVTKSDFIINTKQKEKPAEEVVESRVIGNKRLEVHKVSK